MTLGAARTVARNTLVYGLIALASLVAAIVLFEAYHRIMLLYKIPARVNGAAMWLQNHTLTHGPMDDYFGRTTATHPRGLFKINTVIDIAVAHPTAGILNFSVRTNNVGLLSEHDYVVERDPSRPEYRIAVIGDSMTGTSTATYQWVDTVQELLNSSAVLREKVGGKTIIVYNLGWIGAGFNTFWQEYDRSARYFTPDLVVVNYIDIDLERTGKGHITDDKAMIDHAKEHLGRILDAHPNTIVALMPIYNELMTEKPTVERTRMLMQAMPGLKVEIMQSRLPTQLGKDEIEKWFSVPHDAHLSDRGGEIYARAFAGWIAENISGRPHDFSRTPTKYWDLDPNAPRTRKIVNSLSYIADRPATVAEIKRLILEKEIKGKVFAFFPYSYYLPISGTDGLTVPYTRPLKSGFEQIPFGAGRDDVVYLFVSCTSPPLTLDNPECYHFQHVFVK
jgi:hypothetical protein